MKINFEFLKGDIIKNKKVIIIVLFIISIFELCMILRGIHEKIYFDEKGIIYFISYFVILFASLIGVLILKSSKMKNSILIYSYIYIYLISAWSILISTLDLLTGNYPIVFLTVFMAIPTLCIVDPYFYSTFTVIGTIIMIIVEYHVANGSFIGNAINMIIYCIITIIVIIKSYKIALYKNEFENKLHLLSITDQLTNINNRRALDNKIEELLGKNEIFNLVLLDIDGFKMINDSFGHIVGDECLIKVASFLVNEFNKESVYRFGGDEFAIITYLSGKEIEDKISDINSNLNVNNDKNFTIKLSAGYHCCLSNDSINNLFINADKALYQAKMNKNFKCIRFEEKNNE